MTIILLAGCAQGGAQQSGGEKTGTRDDGALLNEITESGRESIYASPASVTDPTTYAAADETAPAQDLSNVINLHYAHRDVYDGEPLYLFPMFTKPGDASRMLAQNGFVVDRGMERTFHREYIRNQPQYIPSFVTVDSMMHTYHLMFSYLLRHTERDYLHEALGRLSEGMVENSLVQLEMLAGSVWEEAARRNLVFFSVALRLYDPQAELSFLSEEERRLADEELALVMSASGFAASPLFSGEEDYSQYLPRGYYEGDEALESYFRMMMWYGRRHFAQSDESLERSALLMVLALNDESLPEEVLSDWETVYAVTSFFAGESLDHLYYDYRPLLAEAFGEGVKTADLPEKEDAFATYRELTANSAPLHNNMIPAPDAGAVTTNGEEGFRFLGQRFTLDAMIFHNLIFDRVGPDAEGRLRTMPSPLDVPAAIGSDAALRLLSENKDTAFEGYTEQMETMRTYIAASEDNFWTGSLYAGWLDTLRPLLTDKGTGYPFFMQTDAWALKSLETFLASFAELKHDTVLYARQDYGGAGDGIEIIEYDDRGYVEAEPVVFARLAHLTGETIRGLDAFGMLSDDDRADLEKLSSLAESLSVIAEKELRNELPSDEEFELIRLYGESLSYFWNLAYTEDAMRLYGDSFSGWIDEHDFPAALIADIATDGSNGEILHIATGGVSTIYVVVPVDGTLRIAVGTVYSYYEITDTERLTDHTWQRRLGLRYDFTAASPDGGTNASSQEVNTVGPNDKPAWTLSYRLETVPYLW